MPTYYEFDVELQDIQPKIWRRFMLRNTATFADLHRAIQDSFGWQDCHLWEFRLPTSHTRVLAGPAGDESWGPPVPDAATVKLKSYFSGTNVAEWCEYQYDFGDDWLHDVKLVALHKITTPFKRRLVDGGRAAPPEDSGGVHGYDQLILFIQTGETLDDADPDHLAKWLGSWHPDAFDFDASKASFDR
jgi:hypothetical protein